MPPSAAWLVGSTALCGAIGVGCGVIKGWSRRNQWLALFVGMHLGPVGWLAILLGPRRR